MKSPVLRTLLLLLFLAAPGAGRAAGQTLDEFRAAVAEMQVSDLQREAQALRARLERADAAHEKDKAALAAAGEGDKEAAQAAVDAAKADLDDAAARLQAVVNRLGEEGEDVADLQELLISTTGRLSVENLSIQSTGRLMSRWTDRGREWLIANGPGIAFQALLFLVILLVFKILANVVGRVTGRAMSTSRLRASDLLRSFFVNIVKKLILIVGVVIALGQIGFEIGPLLAGIGVVGFVVGFALQETLANFAAGVMILLYRPYDVGHVITAAGETGKVDSMNLVSTTILTADNQVLVVPNGSIWGGTIRNVTKQSTRRVDLTVGIGYGDDIERAEEVILDVVTSHPRVLDDPAPAVKVGSLGDSSVNFLVRPWSQTSDYWDVYWDLTKAIKLRLDKEGISIPFPQRDIHIVSGGLTGAKSA